MADDFFNKKDEVPEKEVEETEEKEEPTKIKLGDEEYDQEDLSSLVKLGKIGREAEEKYQTKIDRIWPEYTKTRQEIKEIKEKAEAETKAKVESKVQAGESLTEQEQIDQALNQAEKMGIVTKRGIRQEVARVVEAKDLLSECKDLEDDISGKDGRPAFKTQDILAHMQETGLRNPEKAYKDKFEAEIDRWKEDQLKKAKPKGLVTEEKSGAGGQKEPTVKMPTGEEGLHKLIEESLYGKSE